MQLQSSKRPFFKPQPDMQSLYSSEQADQKVKHVISRSIHTATTRNPNTVYGDPRAKLSQASSMSRGRESSEFLTVTENTFYNQSVRKIDPYRVYSQNRLQD